MVLPNRINIRLKDNEDQDIQTLLQGVEDKTSLVKCLIRDGVASKQYLKEIESLKEELEWLKHRMYKRSVINVGSGNKSPFS